MSWQAEVGPSVAHPRLEIDQGGPETRRPFLQETSGQAACELFLLTERLKPERRIGRLALSSRHGPVIGKSNCHQGLRFAFGHAHHR